MSYIESLNEDASGEFSCSNSRCSSKVPHDVSHNEEGIDDLNDMKEGDGGSHKLPSQQWISIQQSVAVPVRVWDLSHVVVLAHDKVEKLS